VVGTIAASAGLEAAAICRELCMGWDELARIARHPLMTIGAHTVEHVMLATWPKERARREMAESRDAIEARLGVRPRHFCYPVGDPTSAGTREFELAAELGFETAVTTRPGVLHPEHTGHLTALPRVSLNGAFQKARYVDVFLSGAPFVLWNGFRKVAA
jgi:peptidoglycan/xylan/chitin deacetylase (PgdA/CDA1 family)